jgi:phosphatidylglycerol:prolipoprotein diacylglycerol transferase
MAGVFGGLAGAKLLWVIEHLGQEPFRDLLLSRGGMSWFGGLAGGVGTALIVMRRKNVPIMPSLAAAAPALAIGHAIGRIGCFLVGDDYGRPSNLPWAVAFPKGLPPTDVPVHPTQLYEMFALFLVAWLLIRWRRQHVADAVWALPGAGGRNTLRDRVHPRDDALRPVHACPHQSFGLMMAGAITSSLYPRSVRVLD